MKKLMSLLVVVFTLVMVQSVVSASAGLSVYIDGKVQTYDQPPIVESGRTLVPLRGIFESLGATVSYNSTTKTIVGIKGDTEIILTLGSTEALINEKSVQLDVPAKTVNGRTMVPLRFVSFALGSVVQYDSKTKKIYIKSVAPKTTGQVDEMLSAIHNNDLAKLKEIVESGQDVNEKYVYYTDDEGMEYKITVIVEAAYAGNLEMVKYLIDNGATDLANPLLYAATVEDVPMVKLLVSSGADVNEVIDGSTPLNQAITIRNVELVKYLLENGADPNLSGFGDLINSPLSNAIIDIQILVDDEYIDMPYKFEIVELLIEHGAYGNSIAVDFTIENNHLDALKAILDTGYDPNSIGKEGSHLSVARSWNNQEAVVILIEYGAVE
jgi:ankyrin repeat protein